MTAAEIAPPAAAKWARWRKPGSRIVVLAAVTGLALYLYLPGFYVAKTDDAYITAHVETVSPKIPAYVQVLHIDDNAAVAPGEVLLQLDPRDYQNAVDGAVADLASAQASLADVTAQLTEQQSLIDQAKAAILSDQAGLLFAQQELRRYTTLVRQESAPAQQLQQVQSELTQKQALMTRDNAALAQALAQIGVLQAQSAQARAAIAQRAALLAQARLNLSYTRITAGVAGTVANKTVEPGDFVQPGQALFSIVPNQTYVIANYKETQITDMRPGQPVDIYVDGLANLRLHGHVDSLQRGTGAVFALLPPENATGNFVKIVQRVPVKIVFDQAAAVPVSLAPGMSVETIVHIHAGSAWSGLF